MMSTPILTLDWPAIAGGGFVASVLFLALVERLRRTFVSRDELVVLMKKLDTMQGLYLQVREAAEDARARAATLQAEQERQWERVAEQVVAPLYRITERLDAVCEAQAAHATALDYLGKRLEPAAGVRHPRRTLRRKRA